MDAVIRRSRAATSSMAALREVAVVGAPHPKWLEAVVALIVVAQGLALDEGAVFASERQAAEAALRESHAVFLRARDPRVR